MNLRPLRRTVAVLAAVALVPVAVAQTALEKRLQAALAAASGAQVGVLIHTLDGTPILEHNADLPLKPASVMKLFTTTAALQRFGPSFTLDTSIYLAGQELWVLGGGDPGLGDPRLAQRATQPVTAIFERWADLLKQRGAAELTNIVLDDYVFDDELCHPTWDRDQYQSWYQAPVGGLNFNDNCLDARVEMAAGGPRLTLIPPLPDEFFIADLRAGRKHGLVGRRSYDSDVFEFRGVATHADDLGPITVRRPNVFFGQALRASLETHGIHVRGDVVRRQIGPRLSEAKLVDVQSTPIRDLIWRANTFSQNLFAECLCKSLAAYESDGRRSGLRGSWSGGTALVRTTLGALGVDLRGAELCDGSGLSHDNRVTARQVVTLLEVAKRSPTGPALLESLAVAGSEGTLRRHKGAPYAGHLRAKTGTLAGVHTMAGFFDAPGGVTYVFAVLSNGPLAENVPDRVLQALAVP